MLILANNSVFSKKTDFLSLLFTEKKTITISKVFILLPSIFQALILIFHIWKLSFSTKLSRIILNSQLELIRASIMYGPKLC